MSKIIQKLVPNYKKGRDAQIQGVVIHIGDGTYRQIYSTFLNEEKSSHYCIKSDGSIVQFVLEENTAWHAGKVVRPSSVLAWKNSKLNPNSYTIGIENEGVSTQKDIPEVQYQANAELVEDICTRYNIEISNLTIISHSDIRADKVCPKPINTSKIVKLAQQTRDKRVVLIKEQISLLQRIVNFLISIKNGII